MPPGSTQDCDLTSGWEPLSTDQQPGSMERIERRSAQVENPWEMTLLQQLKSAVNQHEAAQRSLLCPHR